MENHVPTARQLHFHRLKLAKKEDLTKNTFILEFEIPGDLKANFDFEAGQYVTLRLNENGISHQKDYSMTSAPYEVKIALGIKINREDSFAEALHRKLKEGDLVDVSEPRGRFTLISKPHEFRTIIAFAGGIGITPVLSHLKNLLHTEPRTRIFLFYGNRSDETIAFKKDLDLLVQQHVDRLEIHYFFSQQKIGNGLFEGHINGKKVALIINQLLMLDDTDEESTIWDSVDEVLICGKGEMIKSVANACYEHGIPKKNIHFELFQEFNEDIYPVEKEFPLVENINVSFNLLGRSYRTTLRDNRMRLLQNLLIQNYPVPYSCKSGICGSCECILEEGKVEVLENEYLTEKEEQSGKILACMSVVLSENIKVNFDLN